MSSCRSASPRVELLDHSALLHDRDPVAHAEQLFELRRDEHDPGAISGRSRHLVVDLDLRADVHSGRGLVEHEQLGIAGEPSPDDHLLLVAARQVPRQLVKRRRGDPERARRVPAQPRVRPADVMRPNRAQRLMFDSVRFSRTERLVTRPSVRRSSGISARPACFAFSGLAAGMACPRAARRRARAARPRRSSGPSRSGPHLRARRGRGSRRDGS